MHALTFSIEVLGEKLFVSSVDVFDIYLERELKHVLHFDFAHCNLMFEKFLPQLLRDELRPTQAHFLC
jgi:hypothetical protein